MSSLNGREVRENSPELDRDAVLTDVRVSRGQDIGVSDAELGRFLTNSPEETFALSAGQFVLLWLAR
jgi:hypothetical protein